MPQMAPLSWLTLMMIFILILMTFNLINFSINSNPTQSMNPEKKVFSKSWKW
uniref:ATP synthase complex subunit 8 n=1 Tax=Lucanus fortunei TaxID=618010 RepID=A0A5C1VA33_9SCAR|nr:ATP synthase F0 subunit 8 [Lucanus fortunei]QEN73212.1 ATP synthase F0 subunit 8 [Lucanus fortunei]